MIPRSLMGPVILLSFMVLVGFSLARAIQYQSVMGLILSVVSLGAGIYFLYLLAKAKEEKEETA
jgi:hypothetical protein